jgi:glycosyltransferase involved in cell wall biosynthesis
MEYSVTRILAWGDYCAYTGFSNVMSNIFSRLPDIELDVIGINYDGRPDYDHGRFPGRVWPARSIAGKYPIDIYGVQKLYDRLENDDYDRLFILNDPFIVDKVIGEVLKIRATKLPSKRFEIVYYYPLDTTPIVSWIREAVLPVDVPVTYTEFAYKGSIMAVPELDNKLRIIPHGVNVNDFYYVPKDDLCVKRMRDQLTHGRDTFLLVNINRNTPRKDIHRSLMVLAELKRKNENVMMYLHCSPRDIGGDFTVIAQWLGLQEHVDYTYPHDLDPIYGYSVEDLNLIYNSADAVFTTSLGEGWGLSITEAMATKTPTVVPLHSSFKDFSTHGLTWFCRAGYSDSEWIVLPNDSMVLRPLTNINDMGKAIQLLKINYGDPIETNRTRKAHDWVMNLDWNKVVSEQWRPLLINEDER